MKNSPNIRLLFIQMLFALAIGQAALKTGDLICSGFEITYLLVNFHYVFAHLLLSIVILSTSWVGWQISMSSRTTEKINSVYSFQYVILVVEIFLVISYFIIVRGAEIDVNHKIISADANNETFWSVVIFATYLFWDLLTKTREINFKQNDDGTYKRALKPDWKQLLERGGKTTICLGIALFIYFEMHYEKDSLKISEIDVILILLFLFFRSLKQTIKRVYELAEDQLSERVKTQDLLTAFPIKIRDEHYYAKYVIVKIVPGFLLLVSFAVYFLL